MKCIKCQLEHDGSYGSGKYCSKTCRYCFSEERNKKISDLLKGRKHGPMSEEQKTKLSKSHKGIKRAPLSDEHKNKISSALIGIERPYSIGKNNPNFNGRYSNDLDVKKKFLYSVKKRGQMWSDELKKQHSEKMKGDSNWMRGRQHSDATKKKIRDSVLKSFETGNRILNKTMVSKHEKEIANILVEIGYNIKMGVRICDRLYDILIPEKNLIIEYNGDYWHMNPTKYLTTDYNKSCNMTAEQIWNRDILKNKLAKESGYKVHCIWEDEYKKTIDKKTYLKKIIESYE